MLVMRLAIALVAAILLPGFTLTSPDGLMLIVADKAPLAGAYVCANEANPNRVEFSFGMKAGLTWTDNSVPETVEADTHRDSSKLRQHARFMALRDNLFALEFITKTKPKHWAEQVRHEGLLMIIAVQEGGKSFDLLKARDDPTPFAQTHGVSLKKEGSDLEPRSYEASGEAVAIQRYLRALLPSDLAVLTKCTRAPI